MKKSDFEYVLSLLRQYAGWDLSNDKYFIIDKKLYNFICEKGYASVDCRAKNRSESHAVAGC